MITVTDIHYRIGSKILLDRINLELAAGELLAIIGPNGAGKSSLLKTLSGEVTPDSGDVLLNGHNLHGIELDKLALQRAVVKQSNHVMFPFTVYDIVCFGRFPVNKGVLNKHDRAIIDSVMSQLEISHLQDQIYSTLSGGEMQRVQLARAIVQIDNDERLDNKLLLLDEPLSNMDLKHQHHCLAILGKLSERGCAIIIVLHDLNLATAYCSSIAMLDHGELRYHGAAKEFNDIDIINKTYGIDMEIIQHPHSEQFFINPII